MLAMDFLSELSKNLAFRASKEIKRHSTSSIIKSHLDHRWKQDWRRRLIVEIAVDPNTDQTKFPFTPVVDSSTMRIKMRSTSFTITDHIDCC